MGASRGIQFKEPETRSTSGQTDAAMRVVSGRVVQIKNPNAITVNAYMSLIRRRVRIAIVAGTSRSPPDQALTRQTRPEYSRQRLKESFVGNARLPPRFSSASWVLGLVFFSSGNGRRVEGRNGGREKCTPEAFELPLAK